jgi:hypothetical protein
VVNRDHLHIKYKIHTIILIQNKTQLQKNLVINHLINLNLWHKLIMKKLFVEYLDFYNYSVKTIMLI